MKPARRGTLQSWGLAALLAAGFVACDNPRRRTEQAVATADAPALRHDAAVVYKNVFGSADKVSFVSVPAEAWPKSFAHFAPRRVTAYRDGIALTIDASADREGGLYIVPESLELSPAQTSRATFQELKDGVFWYEFGRRGK